MKNKQPQVKKIQNSRARFDYDLKDDYLCGIVLNGRETKALRLGHGQLKGAFINIKDGELWLNNMTITGRNGLPIDEDEKTRPRKLLAKQREIDQLMSAKQQGLSIVPTEVLTRTRFIKVRIAVGRGKKQYDKRATLKKRDDDRNTRRELKQVQH
ncbi:SsrA-binding protein SmpB [bacterium]|nr:SsrA-binding protein SmpB [bacterium]NBX97940.1 SsrA-binding protein SmpB [bacterium]NDC94632.1 SsrA-binding protein SmpB [bacterium]NDD83777.1 SsrA-binding protein SmpB [bacterium]NDG28816.1 SsrA-binding protein SmpB [bacterium]